MMNRNTQNNEDSLSGCFSFRLQGLPISFPDLRFTKATLPCARQLVLLQAAIGLIQQRASNHCSARRGRKPHSIVQKMFFPQISE